MTEHDGLLYLTKLSKSESDTDSNVSNMVEQSTEVEGSAEVN